MEAQFSLFYSKKSMYNNLCRARVRGQTSTYTMETIDAYCKDGPLIHP